MVVRYDRAVPDIRELVIPASGVRTLAWAGDTLVDWAAGGTRYALDGSHVPSNIIWAFPFDGVATAGGSELAAIYTRFGTKALLLKNGSIVRELNRSFYHAHVYEYPICLVKHRHRTLLIHCPDEYNQLEIEEAATGERLTARSSRPADFFHSRLAVNPEGSRLLSAGWIWHPWDAVVYFDIEKALQDPTHLDAIDWCAPPSPNIGHAEESSACWQTNTRTIVGGGQDDDDDPGETARPATEPRLRPRGVVVYDTSTRAVLSSAVLDAPAGPVMPIGETHAIAFYRHPRLIRLSDGTVEHAWPALFSGEQTSSIHGSGGTPLPAMAFDPAHGRFAIAQSDGIHVVTVTARRTSMSA